MKESIVQIAGHQYRYTYDPESKATKYLGPIGSAPSLSEAEFMRVFEDKDEMLEYYNEVAEILGAELSHIQEDLTTDMHYEGVRAAQAPERPPLEGETYGKRMVVFDFKFPGFPLGEVNLKIDGIERNKKIFMYKMDLVEDWGINQFGEYTPESKPTYYFVMHTDIDTKIEMTFGEDKIGQKVDIKHEPGPRPSAKELGEEIRTAIPIAFKEVIKRETLTIR